MKAEAIMRRIITLAVALTLALMPGACKPDGDITGAPGLDLGASDPEGPAPDLHPDGVFDESAAEGLADSFARMPDVEAINEVWDYLGGYWVSDVGLYVGFVREGETCYVAYGAPDAQASGLGEVTGCLVTAKNQATLTIHFEAMPATETSGAIPAIDVVLMLDTRGVAQCFGIGILIAEVGGGSWHQYSYGGTTLDEAYENAR
jgi:hypothetical protein